MSSDVVMLSIPSFELQVEPDIKQLVSKNIEVISEARAIILDIRSNGGGSFFSMVPVLELIGVPDYKSTWQVLASPGNTSFYRKVLPHLSNLDNPHLSDLFSRTIAKMDKHPNQFVEYSYPAINENKALTNLDAVYILTDQHVASTAEEFIIAAKTNPIVKVVGSVTRGALDYGDPVPYSLNSRSRTIMIPSQKRLWRTGKPIDNIGIQPDILFTPSPKDLVSHVFKLYRESMRN